MRACTITSRIITPVRGKSRRDAGDLLEMRTTHQFTQVLNFVFCQRSTILQPCYVLINVSILRTHVCIDGNIYNIVVVAFSGLVLCSGGDGGTEEEEERAFASRKGPCLFNTPQKGPVSLSIISSF